MSYLMRLRTSGARQVGKGATTRQPVDGERMVNAQNTPVMLCPIATHHVTSCFNRNRALGETI